VGQIIAELDAIERWGASLGEAEIVQINNAKLRITQDLLSLAAAASLSYSLPVGLIDGVFWTREEADQAL
jgi:hypothetical protein